MFYRRNLAPGALEGRKQMNLRHFFGVTVAEEKFNPPHMFGRVAAIETCGWVRNSVPFLLLNPWAEN
jgi:hypothetical protein